MLSMTLRLAASWLALFLLLPALLHAHIIDVEAGKKDCFFEDLHKHDKMTVTYQVGGGGHLDIDFWVRHLVNAFLSPVHQIPQLSDPDARLLGKQIRQSTGTLAITAEKDGRHEYCFSNQMSAIADKIVSFNVHGVIYVGDDSDIVAPIEREIRTFSNGLQSVKDEQEYIVVRERTHRNTAESTNSRVKWWSVLQAIVLFSVVAWQVYYLKSFFEVKRVI
ncbi:Supernatant protein factor [Mycena indigotica]|uniref:Supernatant protein factor n=1 Tax=Mycena indigotica TaxID=2126181 RepID=A0A8H6W1F7_9AGAR|nr:Supernatant protein factor [Mycena indigotica]KAF7301502.1 Supernatant protein factor [Mycena indigotica]